MTTPINPDSIIITRIIIPQKLRIWLIEQLERRIKLFKECSFYWRLNHDDRKLYPTYQLLKELRDFEGLPSDSKNYIFVDNVNLIKLEELLEMSRWSLSKSLREIKHILHKYCYRREPMAVGWNRLRDLLQTGDIVHMRTDTIISRLIRWFTRSKGEEPTWASHSAIVYENTKIVEARLTVLLRDLNHYRNKKVNIVITRRLDQLDNSERRFVREKADKYLGKRYGVFKILAHAFDKIIGNRYFFRRLLFMDKYPICSWIVAYIYDRVLGLQFGVPPNAAQPDDILDYCVRKHWNLVWVDSDETLKTLGDVYDKNQTD